MLMISTFLRAYPKNLAPTGPSSRIRLAKASPSMRGGGFVNLSLLRYLQVTRIGIAALRGGTITLTPLCRHPRMAPPLASTRNETRKLFSKIKHFIFNGQSSFSLIK